MRTGSESFALPTACKSKRTSQPPSSRSSRRHSIFAMKSAQRSVDQLRSSAAAIWNDHLNRIEIEGATDDQRRTFYSCLYRTLLFPRTWHEPDADGHPHHFSAFNGKVMPGVMYADHGYWDVYRAWYPSCPSCFQSGWVRFSQAWVNAYKKVAGYPSFPVRGTGPV